MDSLIDQILSRDIALAYIEVCNFKFDLTEELTMQSDEQYVCNLLDCPSLTALKSGLAETVDVLKKTKTSFKSKELGRLRDKLEILVEKEKK